MDHHLPNRLAIRRSNWLPLASVLLLALALRVALLAVAWNHSPDLATLHAADTHTYVEPAESLLQAGTFSDPSGPELHRTPGYPLLLLPGIALGHIEAITVGLQMVLALATVWLVYRLAFLLTGSRAAAVAAGLFLAVEPLSITYTSYLMPETLFTFLLVLVMTALAGYFRRDRLIQIVIAGALLAAATFVRPVSYYLLPIIALMILARDYRQLGAKWRCALGASIFLAVSVIPVAAWQARNTAVADYRGFSAISDWNLFFYQAASVVAHERHQSLETAQSELGYLDDATFYRLHPELEGVGQAAILHFMHREGVRLLRQHPAAYAKIHLRGMAQLALNPGASDLLRLIDRYPENSRSPHPIDTGILGIVAQMHREAPLVLYTNLLLAIGLGIVYSAAAFGLLGSLGHWNWDLTLLVLVAAYLLAIAGGPTCVPRLRQPAMPLVCVLSGIGISQWLRRRSGRRRGDDSQPDNRRMQPSEAKTWPFVRESMTPHRSSPGCLPSGGQNALELPRQFS